jgi:putative transposase
MSASSQRYRPRNDRNEGLSPRIVALVQCYRRYGSETIFLKLRQAGAPVNTMGTASIPEDESERAAA